MRVEFGVVGEDGDHDFVGLLILHGVVRFHIAVDPLAGPILSFEVEKL